MVWLIRSWHIRASTDVWLNHCLTTIILSMCCDHQVKTIDAIHFLQLHPASLVSTKTHRMPFVQLPWIHPLQHLVIHFHQISRPWYAVDLGCLWWGRTCVHSTLIPTFQKKTSEEVAALEIWRKRSHKMQRTSKTTYFYAIVVSYTSCVDLHSACK